MPAFIPRKLVYSVDGEIAVIAHTDLLERPENLVVLGEAGMGKSRLLEELAKAGGKRVTARRLISTRDPRQVLAGNSLVLIDALDEAPAFAEGGVVDQLLGQLEQAAVSRFVLACRSEDWQAATAKSIIAETYGNPPLELRLRPFDEAQIAEFLTEQLGPEQADQVIAIYHSRGFREWLGNPQTLIMLAEVAKSGDLPKTTSELFEAYVELCLREMNPVRRQRNREISREAVLDTLGAAFASLILSGKSALAKPGAEFSEDDLRLAELETLPGFADWTTLSGNRLAVTYRGDSERLTYSHRRIGEWLGARWLAKHAGSESVADRLFASLTVEGIVPASLRGLFAWLASNSTLAFRAIATDPMAIIEYGDADILNEAEGEFLDELITNGLFVLPARTRRGIEIDHDAFLRLLATHNGRQLDTLCRKTGWDDQTFQAVIDSLVDHDMIFTLPFEPLISGRSDLYYFRDTGVLHRLFNPRWIEAAPPGRGHFARSWEGLAIQTLMHGPGRGARATIWRHADDEIDLVLRWPEGIPCWAIEIGMGENKRPSKGFWAGVTEVGATHQYVLHQGVCDQPGGYERLTLERFLERWLVSAKASS